ncbi:MAG: hypothetical protein DYH15_08370 [Nitrosomonas sp. PRO4]|nr:hypothetical protein [Nitrosomonas sp. PRO4]
MSRAVLISMHPEHVANILSGAKVFEYRKVMPTQDISYLILYCTAPVKKIVAAVEVVGRLVGPPSRVWVDTAYGAGITRKFYRDYFSGKSSAGSFTLGNVYELPEPLELAKLSSCKVPPQSFCYLNARDTSQILKQASPIPSTPSSLIFVGGIHGVGKTTLCLKAFAPFGYQCMTASFLISTYGRRIDKNKQVHDIYDNQTALIEQLVLEKKKYCRFLLDGHFTLINSQGHIEPVDHSVFQRINPTQLILIKGDPEEIARRLAIRDGKEWNPTFVEEFQKEEEKHAKLISKKLKKDLFVLDNKVNSRSAVHLFRKISRIIRNKKA